MKIKNRGKIKQKIVIPLIIILLTNFITPKISNAAFDIGGFLISPLCGLFATIGDAVNDLLWFLSANDIKRDARLLPKPGDSAYVEGDNKQTFIDRHANDGTFGSNTLNLPVSTMYTGEIQGNYGFPNIKVTPAEIFANKIPLLNANYFQKDYRTNIGTSDETTASASIAYHLKEMVASWYNTLRLIAVVGLLSVLIYLGIRILLTSVSSKDQAKYKEMLTDWVVALCLVFCLHYIMSFTMSAVDAITSAITGASEDSAITWQVYVSIVKGEKNVMENPEEAEDDLEDDLEDDNNKDAYLPYKGEKLKLSDYFTDEEILLILNEYNAEGITGEPMKDGSRVRAVIDSIMEEKTPNLYALTYNFTIEGIDNDAVKILNTDVVSEENRKYFFFEIDGNSYSASDFESVNNGVFYVKDKENKENVVVKDVNSLRAQIDWKSVLEEYKAEVNKTASTISNIKVADITDNSTTYNLSISKKNYGTPAVDDESVNFYTNLTGYMRLSIENIHFGEKVAATVMYLALTMYTVYFIFIYLKRLLMLTFLTLIAPLITLTYPIDKVKDGKAQAFNYWLKEYTANAILPIIHSILYTVLVTTANELVVGCPIYAIAALAFIVPAEKLVKQMFGLESQTAPALGGFAGGVATSSLLQKFANKGKGGKDEKDKTSSGGSGKNGIRTKAQGIKATTGDYLAVGDGETKPSQSVEKNSQANKSQGKPVQGQEKPVQGKRSQRRNIREYKAKGKKAQRKQAQRKSKQKEQEKLKQKEQEKPQVQSKSQPQEKSESKSQQNEKLTRWKKLKNGASNVAKNGSHMIGKKFNLKRGKIPRQILAGAGRKLLKGAARASLMGIGLAGGIVGGNLGDMWKGAAGGFAAGNILGNKLSNKTVGLAGRVSDVFTELGHGEAAADYARSLRDFSNDDETYQYIREKHKDAKPKEKKELIRKMHMLKISGASDNLKELDTLVGIQDREQNQIRQGVDTSKFSPEELKEFNEKTEEQAAKKAIYTGKASQLIPKSDLMLTKKRNEYIDSKAKQFQMQSAEMGYKMSDAEAKAQATKLITDVMNVQGTYK